MALLITYKPTKFIAKTSYYDNKSSDYAVSFIQALCQAKGTLTGKSVELIVA